MFYGYNQKENQTLPAGAIHWLCPPISVGMGLVFVSLGTKKGLHNFEEIDWKMSLQTISYES